MRTFGWLVCFITSCATVNLADDGSPTFDTDADQNMALGEKAFSEGSYSLSGKYFEHVRSKFPFAEASKMALLRMADVDYQEERFLEARDRYQTFVKQYPTHAKIDYAAFRVAMTHVKKIPSAFFLAPSPEERDQIEVRNAALALKDFLRGYPGSEYSAEAEKVLKEVHTHLAGHEWRVAEFYFQRAKYDAVAGRLRTLLDRYPNTQWESKALWRLYVVYIKMKEDLKARSVLEEIQTRVPDSKDAERATRMLKG